MDFIFIRPDGTQFILPLNPQAPELTMGGKSDTFESIDLGDIEVFRGKMPLDISWNGILPGRGFEDASFIKEFDDPYVIADTLRIMTESNELFQLIVSDTFLSVFVHIKEFKPVIGTGAGHIPYSIHLIEDRPVAVYTDAELGIVGGVIPTAPKLGPTAGGNTRPADPLPYTILTVPGDTLGKLAQKWLGDSSKWGLFRDENSEQLLSEDFLKAHPSWWPTKNAELPAGLTLKVPGGKAAPTGGRFGGHPED